jgi:hypothetical protein
LPNTQLFSSKDRKHKRLVPTLLRADQSFVDGDELKIDLGRISEKWEEFSKEEQIALNAKRGDAPPENETSVIYNLWKKHGGEINPSREIVDRKLVDFSLPKPEQFNSHFANSCRRRLRKFVMGEGF